MRERLHTMLAMTFGPSHIRESLARLAAFDEAVLRLQAVVPPDEWPAWQARANAAEQRAMALSIETTAAYTPGEGYRAAYEAACRGEKP